jgi:aspartate racemase
LFPHLGEVGVLATSGTLASGVYREALESCGLLQVAPGPASQARVMSAIYGVKGVKAGYTSGQCVDDIRAAVEELATRGVKVMILGCTELPLLLPEPELRTKNGQTVTLIDPTETLAKHCVDHVIVARNPL